MARREKALNFYPKTFLAKVGAGKTQLKARKGQIIFSQGDESDSVFHILAGKVKLTVVSERGKEAILGILEIGDFFGEACLVGQRLRVSTATSIENSTIVRIEKESMVRVLHEKPAISQLFMSYILTRNVRIEENLVDQLFNSSEKRLARILLQLARFGNDSRVESVVPRISQDALAAMVGTTRARVSSFMNKFRKLGFIDYNGDLQVFASLLNFVLHDYCPLAGECRAAGRLAKGDAVTA